MGGPQGREESARPETSERRRDLGHLPLELDDQGEGVAEVQRRLTSLGFACGRDPDGLYLHGTRSAVEAFQYLRGLRVDGIVGPQTWATMVEAGFSLGSRLLYRRSPMIRGDDVAELQQRLGALGFNTGRVDGIFGDSTAEALGEFQMNFHIPADGILGSATLAELLRVEPPHHPDHPTFLVSTISAREHLRQSPPTLAGRHIAIGELGGLAAALTALRRRLVAAGARATAFHHPDGSVQARQANTANVDLYLGLRLSPEVEGCTTSYYSGYRDESPGGRRLSELIQASVPPALGIVDRGTHGMSLPLLRETRMPAVIVEIGPAAVVVEHTLPLVKELVSSLASWTESFQS